MPELPEVETIRRDLEAEIVGRRIQSAVVTGTRTVRRQDRQRVVDALAGRMVSTIRRKGKFLFVDFDDGNTLVVHLRMSGQLLWTPDIDTPLAPHTHARLLFDDGVELRFVDPRTFGELWVTTPDVPEISHMGPDALGNIDIRERFAQRKSALKLLLVNQQVIAGIGNIYADEILWAAKLRPERQPVSLSKAAVNRLEHAMHDVLTEAVEARGSSLRDQQYVDLYGGVGRAQRSHRVYARAGEPCARCSSTIVRLPLGTRSAYSCRNCQR